MSSSRSTGICGSALTEAGELPLHPILSQPRYIPHGTCLSSQRLKGDAVRPGSHYDRFIRKVISVGLGIKHRIIVHTDAALRTLCHHFDINPVAKFFIHIRIHYEIIVAVDDDNIQNITGSAVAASPAAIAQDDGAAAGISIVAYEYVCIISFGSSSTILTILYATTIHIYIAT